MFGGNVWHRGPAVDASTRTILSLVACKNDQDVKHDSAKPYPWPKKIAAPLSPNPGGKPLEVVDPAQHLCMEERPVQPGHIATGLTLHTHFGIPANIGCACPRVPVQQLMSTAENERAGNATHTALDDRPPHTSTQTCRRGYYEQMDESALLACLDELQSDDKSCEDALKAWYPTYCSSAIAGTAGAQNP